MGETMIGTVPWDVNYIAVVVATVVGMIIGAIYYHPSVVGKAWMASTGRTDEQLKANAGAMLWVVTTVITLLMATVLAAAISWSGEVTLGSGVLVGLVIWLGITLPVVTMTFLYEGRGYDAVAITLGHHLILMAVMGAVIGWFPWGGI